MVNEKELIYSKINLWNKVQKYVGFAVLGLWVANVPPAAIYLHDYIVYHALEDVNKIETNEALSKKMGSLEMRMDYVNAIEKLSIPLLLVSGGFFLDSRRRYRRLLNNHNP